MKEFLTNGFAMRYWSKRCGENVSKQIQIDKIDVVVPSKTGFGLLLKKEKWMNNIIITTEKPLSIARKNAVLKAKTEYVAMLDDDIKIPSFWFEKLKRQITSKTAAVSSVATQFNEHEQAYDNVVHRLKRLEKIDTSPHINNIIILRSIMEDYNPPPLFYGEDHFLKRHIISKGYQWKVVGNIGVIHFGTSKNKLLLGEAYRFYHLYSSYQMVRRFISKLILIPYAAMTNMSIETFKFLLSDNISFFSGYAKQLIEGNKI
jgi:glycosyltransferase involved in cell wall biosynthesis